MLNDRLIEKIRRFSAARVAQIEDFVDFLAQRDRDTAQASAASEPAFAKVWDNPEDDVYDRG